MCDTMAVIKEGRVLFAKNSDRDVNEAQFLDWHRAAEHAKGSKVRCTWIEIPQVQRTNAVLLSRPFWIWGAEMGANEHGVAIGNEAVFTRQPLAKSGLTGMDLLRLALERADTAQAAVEVIVELIQAHGQGGGCGYESRRFNYHNSFLAADPESAVVLETAGKEWVTEEVKDCRSISNYLSIEGFAGKHSDFLYTKVAQGRQRRAITEGAIQAAEGPGGLFEALRSHGEAGEYPHYNFLNGAMGLPCMHAGGLATGSQTTGSWAAELRPGGSIHWVTGTAAPCTGLFKPVRVEQPLDLGPEPKGTVDGSLWWRHEALHRRVARNPGELLPLYAEERDLAEAQWLADPPEPAAAFKEADRLLGEWTRKVSEVDVRDVRPWYVRMYWAKRNRKAVFEYSS